ncbi:TPA: host cell division inhibitor Icd-like protein [Escherichia coli]|uniref:Ash protein family protein n=1 Tax=Caudovirales sp. ct7964 TaxID=2825758 RepID=A0A8S5PGR8_9CAUD|nr:host cell division inhibitor Icd-like protein [Escherichia coli]UXI73938.1 host cell division inhibitor Icd-like protein [Escherichia coli]DAE05643.1 MAG TPA: Ash protein family protein [Caudovirales sp. ct7964]HCL6011112.1 host cell division inhibitor Icd-like protein [Escherichia coli]
MLNAAVQNKAFPLAGLMFANVNVWSKAARRQIATNSDVWNLSKPDICHRQIFTNLGVFGRSTHAHECEAGITAPANASPSFYRRGDEEFSEKYRRAREGEFLESIKKGLPTIANPVYGYRAPAESGAGIGVPEMIKATHDAPSVFFCAVNPTHAFFSDAGIIIRAAHEIMVGWMGASTEAPVSLIAGYANPVQSTTSKIGVFGGGFKTLIKEAAAMLATIPTQNPQFIWLIAAVRRDMPTITAKIYHIAAESEHEARRTLARDHVCFFAGRIRLEVAA